MSAPRRGPISTPVDQTLPSTREVPRTDLLVFLPALAVALCAGFSLVLAPASAADVTGRAMAAITHDFGWLFVLTAAGILGFAIWLAFGPYGQVKLGLPEDVPEYSELSWAAMMFSAGIGAGLVSWAFVRLCGMFVQIHFVSDISLWATITWPRLGINSCLWSQESH